MNGADRMMDEYLGQVATTDRDRGEYLRLVRTAADTTGQWRKLEESAGGPLAGVTDHLACPSARSVAGLNRETPAGRTRRQA